jgi:AraC-like DNA-binding protein
MVARPERWRPPSLQLPFHLRSTGFHQFTDYSKENPSVGDGFVQVFWGISGEIELHVDGEIIPLKAGDVVWKLKKESHGYKSTSPGGEFRWFTFEGSLADSFMLGYGYPRKLNGAGPCPTALFLEMERCLKEMSPYSQRRMISIASELLALAGRRLGAKEEASRVVERVVEIIQTHYQESGLNVNALADTFGCHRATLTRRFMEMMGVSPGEYLARLRMQEASALLRNSQLPIGEIGGKIGMPNRSHFSRAVKRATGRTPGALRKLGPDEGSD